MDRRETIYSNSRSVAVISDSIAPLLTIEVDNIHLCLYNGSRRGGVTHFSQLQLDVTEGKRTRRARDNSPKTWVIHDSAQCVQHRMLFASVAGSRKLVPPSMTTISPLFAASSQNLSFFSLVNTKLCWPFCRFGSGHTNALAGQSSSYPAEASRKNHCPL